MAQEERTTVTSASPTGCATSTAWMHGEVNLSLQAKTASLLRRTGKGKKAKATLQLFLPNLPRNSSCKLPTAVLPSHPSLCCCSAALPGWESKFKKKNCNSEQSVHKTDTKKEQIHSFLTRAPNGQQNSFQNPTRQGSSLNRGRKNYGLTSVAARVRTVAFSPVQKCLHPQPLWVYVSNLPELVYLGDATFSRTGAWFLQTFHLGNDMQVSVLCPSIRSGRASCFWIV